MTTSVVLQNGATTRQQGRVLVRHVVTAAQNTANVAIIPVDELTTITDVFGVQISTAAGVHRNPQGAVTVSGRSVTVNDTGLDVNEIIKFTAVGV
jgi:hypothetical protein